jgi:hypothetical protein
MDAVQKVGNGHPGTAMSLAPAAYLLFQKVMRHNPADPHWPGRDRFVLSCGHSSLTLYIQLFLGGWGVPFSWFGWHGIDVVANWMNVVGPLVMFTKMIVLTFLMMWVRFSYPRFREDQLQRFAWKVLIPVALLNIMVTAVLKVVF